MTEFHDDMTRAIHAAAAFGRALGSRDSIVQNRAVRARADAELANRLVDAGSGEKLIEIVAGVILEAVNKEVAIVEGKYRADFETRSAAFQAGVLAAVERAVKGIQP
jgi:dihydroxyacetone kinase DhaKLM complex PTS-EIIA-like component DhaM